MDKIPVTHKGSFRNHDFHQDEHPHEDLRCHKNVHRHKGDDVRSYEDVHCHRPVDACSILIFRTLTAVATAASIALLLKSDETTYYHCLKLSEGWRSFESFKWFVAANAVVFVYSVLGAIISFLAICVRRGPLSFSHTAWLTFLIDFLLASALLSAASAALAVWWVGTNGVYAPRWTGICDEVNAFCNRIEAAVITSFVGWLFLALSAFVAVSSLHDLGARPW